MDATVELMATVSRVKSLTRNDDVLAVCNALEIMLLRTKSTESNNTKSTQSKRGGRRIGAGRKPIGDRAMTQAERARRSKANKAGSPSLGNGIRAE